MRTRARTGQCHRACLPGGSSHRKLPLGSCALHHHTFDGASCRKLGKKVQEELAEANAVADEALANIATVRAHAAEDSVKASYAAKLQDFYKLEVGAQAFFTPAPR